MAKPMKSKILRDPIHGSIELDGELVTIIDTPQFQRLRRIKQLGGASFVYPGAVHTRFEHSIGVCHIAGELMKTLLELHSETPGDDGNALISQEDALCVQIAALCHDLGHGPFSHLYDKLVMEVENKDKPDCRKHEYRSAKIVENILQESGFWSTQLKTKLPEGRRPLKKGQDLEFIQKMITFSAEFEEATADVGQQRENESDEDFNKRFYPSVKKFIQDQLVALEKMGRSKRVFLFEIVANGLTGIDVDKMDYFARDSHGLGLPNRFDWRRYIQVAKVKRVLDNASTPECYRLCTLDKEVVNLYELFHTRAVLHQIAYQHKTTRAVEYVFRNALKESCVEVHMKSEGAETRKRTILNCWRDMDAFHLLDDTLVDIILKTGGGEPQTDPEASCLQLVINQENHLKIRDELSRVVDKRRLPKFVGSMGHSKEESASAEFDYCKDECLFSERIKINYGMKNQDPLKLHVFYSKLDEEKDPLDPFKFPRKIPLVLVPKEFEEIRYFWYYDTHKHGEGADECLKKLRMWARSKH